MTYEPAESTTALFGGNSNWRGPIWMPLNVLLVEALRDYGTYLGPGVTLEYPAGSGDRVTLGQAADDLSRRLVSIFLPGAGRPPAGLRRRTTCSPPTRAGTTTSRSTSTSTATPERASAPSHQTGWTALVAHLIIRLHRPTG